MTIEQVDKVAAINMELHHAGLPTYTQVLDTLNYLATQALMTNLPSTNGALKAAARIRSETVGVTSGVY
jgi:hypothetical protein